VLTRKECPAKLGNTYL